MELVVFPSLEVGVVMACRFESCLPYQEYNVGLAKVNWYSCWIQNPGFYRFESDIPYQTKYDLDKIVQRVYNNSLTQTNIMIEAGYCIFITSWENDGDAYNTKRIYGLSKADAKCLLELCKYLQKYCSEQEDLDPGVLLAVVPMLESSDSYKIEYSEHAVDCVSDLIFDLVGCVEHSGAPRVCDSYECYYIPTDLVDLSKTLS